MTTAATRTRIAPYQVKALLASYAAHQVRSARSQLGNRSSNSAGSCILTIGVIIAHTPAAYRLRGVSILDKWCEARQVEAEIVDELASTRSLRNGTTRLDVSDYCDRKLKALDRALHMASERVYGIEGNPHFEGALSWVAVDLERRLSRVPLRELMVWQEMLGCRLAG